MITNAGKLHIKRFLAGYVPSIAESVAFGIGSRVEAASDIALQMETTSSPINLSYFDFASNKLIYKASVSDNYVGTISEIGIYSLRQDPTASNYGSRLLSTFDSATENWVDATTDIYAPFSTASPKVGIDSLALTPAASATAAYALKDIQLDLSGYTASDTLNFAFNVSNTNTNQIIVRFMTDTSNYYDFIYGAQTSGYKFLESTKGSATIVGQPDWSRITQIRVLVTSKSAGASNVQFDAIRIEDKSLQDLDYILVARKVLTTTQTKIAGQPQEIEFALDVTL